MKEKRKLAITVLITQFLFVSVISTGTYLIGQRLQEIRAQSIINRTYWIEDPAKFSKSGSVHTHVQITGWVVYTRYEEDGDLHIKVTPTKGAFTPFFIAECIPKLPCNKPNINSQVMIQGISRYDKEHNWWEIHPVEFIQE